MKSNPIQKYHLRFYKRKLSKIHVLFTVCIFGILMLGPFITNLLFESQSDHVIKLTRKGFVPKEIAISMGDSITFKTIENTDFWPASDPHPTHEYLFGFDSKRALHPGEEWEYTFQNQGTWRFHDHLNPEFTGTIVVGDGTSLKTTDEKSCEKLQDKDREQCIYDLIKTTAEEKGVDEAFDIFTKAYSTGEPLACHWTAHLIGDEAYRAYTKGKKFKITKATSYCGYGFYHGFLEPMLRENPDPKFALDFCNEVGKQLGQEGLKNCFHGIGHGFTEEPPDTKTWGKPEEMVKPGLAICTKMFGENVLRSQICSSGVYTVVATFITEGKYGTYWDTKDPFAFCRTQDETFRGPCYGEFAPKLSRIVNGDPEMFVQYIKTIDDPSVIESALLNGIGAMIQGEKKDASYKKYILSCRNFDNELRLVCIKGVVWGIIMNGVPEQEYAKATVFCESPDLNSDEKSYCLDAVFSRFKGMYTKEKFELICNQKQTFKDACSKVTVKNDV